MEQGSKSSWSNRVLGQLGEADRALVDPFLQRVAMPRRDRLEPRGTKPRFAYFPETGFASVVVLADGSPGIEVGMVGNEGLTGMSIVLGVDEPVAHECYQQVAGVGIRIARESLQLCMERSRSLRQTLLSCAYRFLIQVTRTAASNACNRVDERLARWLLMADDRIKGPMPLTQEFLALMIGVHRPKVTILLLDFERRGWIERGRGQISITSRTALERHTHGSYDPRMCA